MSLKIHGGMILLRGWSVLLVIAMLFLIVGLSVGADPKFCGTQRCSAGRNLDGTYFVEFWCQGSYPFSGTCKGPPTSIRFFELSPSGVSCTELPPCPTGKCGLGSTILQHLSCNNDGQTATYSVNCAANDNIVTKAV